MDKRIGKCLRGANPKCPLCSEYLDVAISMTGDQIWRCLNCNATFEKVKGV